jgi:hypothetical protein
VQEQLATPERELYQRVGLDRLLDSNTGKYQTSLLQVLDDINQDRKASPLFRAWLFMQVCEMIDVQPVQWGAIWSPDLAEDRTNLVRLGATQIRSGDWLIPAKIASLAPRLNAHFAEAGNHSYARQSSFYKRLLPKILEGGVTLVGYNNAEGRAIFNDRSGAAGPVFGFSSASEPPTLIFEKLSANERPRTSAMPFSPFFVARVNTPELIDSTLRTLGYSAAAVGIPGTLPPILRSTQ